MAEKKATRDAYGEALLELGKDERVVVLDADLSESTRSSLFQRKYPERFFNMGICEQDMMGTAAGFALSGKIPFASTFAIFACCRSLDQIRNSIAYPRLNVKIIGTHSGLLIGEDGVSHQAIEDVAVLRAIPNMVVLSPADYIEAKKAVNAAYEYNGPVYIRMGREKLPILYDEAYAFEIGKASLLREGNDITLIATGPLVFEALKAHDLLKQHKINARIINMSTIKPIDKEIIIKASKETKAIITCEDHNIIGGLGSAVAEVLSENYPVKMKRIGINDAFAESGSAFELYKKYGLTAENIVENAIELNKK
jgi:transketolase